MNPPNRIDSQGPTIAVIGDGIAGCASILAVKNQGFEPIWVRLGLHYARSPWPESIDTTGIDLLRELIDVSDFLMRCQYPLDVQHTCWGSDRLITKLNRRLHRKQQGLSLIDKGYLLDRLEEKARSISRLVIGEIKRIVPVNGGIEVTMADRGITHCDAIILASGSSPIRHQFSKFLATSTFQGNHWLLRQADGPHQAVEACSFIEAFAKGWWYGATLNDRSFSLLLMTEPAEPLPQQVGIDALLENLNQTVHLKKWIKHHKIRCIDHHHGFRHECGNMRSFCGAMSAHQCAPWFAVGNAAISLDPLSSFGLTSSIWSAIHAAKWLKQCFSGGTVDAINGYQQDMEAFCLDINVTRADIYDKEQRFEGERFWQKRHSRLLT